MAKDHHGNSVPEPRFTKDELWAMRKKGVDIRQYKQVQDWLRAESRDLQDAKDASAYWDVPGTEQADGWVDDDLDLEEPGENSWELHPLPELVGVRRRQFASKRQRDEYESRARLYGKHNADRWHGREVPEIPS